ncbi:hypothetical protein B0J13DRAFT_32978 [Dactylonectria estremocensis]|uniref:Uncharacterized protein n=1 Tax=Dactylonectria estremocensis TaxID=1079267 RepID=A0A9P9FJ77_9HYPO|nr:hypothetical protein B0J13DRAFT_32978 [Dactylonectria estremocensis]
MDPTVLLIHVPAFVMSWTSAAGKITRTAHTVGEGGGMPALSDLGRDDASRDVGHLLSFCPFSLLFKLCVVPACPSQASIKSRP